MQNAKHEKKHTHTPKSTDIKTEATRIICTEPHIYHGWIMHFGWMFPLISLTLPAAIFHLFAGSVDEQRTKASLNIN